MKKHLSRICLLLLGSIFATAALAAVDSVKTRGGNELGLSLSSYKYEEPEIGMSTSGEKFGFSHTGTLLLGNDIFLRDDLRFVNGAVDYLGSGISLDEPDWYYEVRVILGRDLPVNKFVLSPYTGFGYRYLFNDIRGYTNWGAIGYRRESNYFYVPMGLTHRVEIQNGEVLATTFEFDMLLYGEQVTRLSDVLGHNGYTAIADTTNRQNSGYGVRMSAMYEMDDVSFGPFWQSWEIADSVETSQLVTKNGSTKWMTGTEPKNRCASTNWRAIVGESPIQERSSEPS